MNIKFEIAEDAAKLTAKIPGATDAAAHAVQAAGRLLEETMPSSMTGTIRNAEERAQHLLSPFAPTVPHTAADTAASHLGHEALHITGHEAPHLTDAMLPQDKSILSGAIKPGATVNDMHKAFDDLLASADTTPFNPNSQPFIPKFVPLDANTEASFFGHEAPHLTDAMLPEDKAFFADAAKRASRVDEMHKAVDALIPPDVKKPFGLHDWLTRPVFEPYDEKWAASYFGHEAPHLNDAMLPEDKAFFDAAAHVSPFQPLAKPTGPVRDILDVRSPEFKYKSRYEEPTSPAAPNISPRLTF